MNRSTVRISLLLVSLAAVSVARAQNIVLNPSFEATPDFDNYTLTGSPFLVGSAIFGGATALPTDGSKFALFGFQNGTDGLSQPLATTPGAAYTVGFDLRVMTASNTNPSPIQSMNVTFGGTSLLSLSNSPAGDWVHYSFPVTAATISDVLGFATATTFNGVYALDNLTVTPVPEPATLGALGLGALGLCRRRRKA